MSDEMQDAGLPHDEPVAPVIPPAPAPTDLVVEDWFARHFHGMGAFLDERTHNLLHAAKEDLKRVLAPVSSL